jgi:hypothetical protein
MSYGRCSVPPGPVPGPGSVGLISSLVQALKTPVISTTISIINNFFIFLSINGLFCYGRCSVPPGPVPGPGSVGLISSLVQAFNMPVKSTTIKMINSFFILLSLC